jgi:hypothetical protein
MLKFLFLLLVPRPLCFLYIMPWNIFHICTSMHTITHYNNISNISNVISYNAIRPNYKHVILNVKRYQGRYTKRNCRNSNKALCQHTDKNHGDYYCSCMMSIILIHASIYCGIILA